MYWIIKDMNKIDLPTRKMLARSTPNWKGYKDFMRLAAQRAAKNRIKSGQYFAVILMDKDLVGWAMCDFFYSKNSKNLRVYVYVKPQFRRKGYGTTIIKKTKEIVKRRGKAIRVYPHDNRSRKFFMAVKINPLNVAPGYSLNENIS